MIRLFVGLALPDGVIARINLMCSGIPGACWVAPGNLHLTLRFIGEVDEDVAAGVDYGLRQIEAPAFPLELAGLGIFGKATNPHSLWIGVTPSPDLVHLQAKVESAVVRSGLAPEKRKFTPHVTLARMTRPDPLRLQHFIEGNGLFHAGPFTADRFILFESRLGKEPVYINLAEYPLVNEAL